MDANQTRFHLLLGQRDWAPTAVARDDGIFPIPDSNLEWDDTHKELRLRSEPFYFEAARRDDPPEQTDRRGAAADVYSNWYWVAESGEEIRIQASGEFAPAHFWSAPDASCVPPPTDGIFQPAAPPPPPPARLFSGLTITEDHYLVVGTLEPHGLLVFDLLGGGPPRTICWPSEILFAPFDIVPRHGGGVWILDRKNNCFWGLDRTLRVIAQDQTEKVLADAEEDIFQPTSEVHHGRFARTFPEGINLMQASPIQALDPVAIETLSDDSVIILDAPPGKPSRVLRYRFGELLQERPLDFPAYDFAFAAGKLFIVSAEGNQAREFAVADLPASFRLQPTNQYFPMRRFGGKALVAAGGRVYYDFGERWLPLITQSHPRHVAEATLETRVQRDGMEKLGFDGREPQCVWHRLMLDACLPPGTDVEVSSRAADDEGVLQFIAWEREPPLHRRSNGSELPFAPEPASPDRGTFELLLQRARGRFLQLRLRLVGDGRRTPHLTALRVYYPRFSYLDRYLPAVYREDAASASFLDRFLANIEGTNTAIEDRIAAVQMLFDVRSAPADAIEWLASWFGVVLDPAWDETRRRLFIAHAMEFFQWRGTVRGLKMALRLALEDHVDLHIFDPPSAKCRCADRFRIVEKFLTRGTPAVELGDPSEAAIGPLLAPAGGKWRPQHGAAALHARYKDATGQDIFSLTPITDAEAEAARIAFAQRELGFVPSDPAEEIIAWKIFAADVSHEGLEDQLPAAKAIHLQRGRATARKLVPPRRWSSALPEDEPSAANVARLWHAFQTASDAQPYGRQRRMWQQFLVRRYVSLVGLNQAHSTHWTSFEDVAYPAVVPANLARLADWIEFERHVLPTLAAAHRFTVLLPVKSNSVASESDRRRDLALASRIVELEKPAHTVFDVKFFWANFRVGEARLGFDTVLGLGARDPAFLPRPAVLGESYLSESLIDSGPPPSLPGRIVIGRDRLKRKPKNNP